MVILAWILVIVCIVGSIAMGILNYMVGNMPMVALMGVCLVLNVAYSVNLYAQR